MSCNANLFFKGEMIWNFVINWRCEVYIRKKNVDKAQRVKCQRSHYYIYAIICHFN